MNHETRVRRRSLFAALLGSAAVAILVMVVVSLVT
jgi:hypothetical protein